jgi:hypothetical protein
LSADFPIQEIHAASVTTLRTDLKIAADDISFLSGTVQEWRRLVDSHGGFSVVGYTMVTNIPLPYFDRICHFPGAVNR